MQTLACICKTELHHYLRSLFAYPFFVVQTTSYAYLFLVMFFFLRFIKLVIVHHSPNDWGI